MRLSLNNSFSKGFTAVELIVVLLITGILLGILFTPVESLYTSNNKALKSIIQTGNVRSALRDIESEVSLAISFHDTNTSIVNDPSGSNNNVSSPTQWTWTGSGASSRVLIASVYATSELPELDDDASRTLVYQDDCQTPIINALIYFVRDGNLYRRTLANTDMPRCSDDDIIAQKTSCANGVTSGPCANAPRDAKLLENVTDFRVDYYQTPSSSNTIADQYVNTSAPGNSQTIVITLTAGTGSEKETGSIRITRLNGTTL